MPDGHEAAQPVDDRDVSTRAILAAGLAILLALLLAVLAAHALLRVYAPHGVGQNAAGNRSVGGARLQSAPQTDKAHYLAEKRRRLESYGWVDRQAGIAHIPIDVAMKQLTDGQGQESRR
jgi:hypothetical protein